MENSLIYSLIMIENFCKRLSFQNILLTTVPFFVCEFLIGYTKVYNHPQSSKAIHNHLQPFTIIQKSTHNHPHPSTTTHNHPQLSTTTQKSTYNHPQPFPTTQKLPRQNLSQTAICYCSLDDSDMKEWYMYMCVCLCVYILYKSLYLLFFC